MPVSLGLIQRNQRNAGMLAYKHLHAGIALIALDEPRTDWHIALTWRRNAHLPPAARAWLDLATEMGNVPSR